MSGIAYEALIDTTQFNDRVDSLVFALRAIVHKWKMKARGYDCNDGLGWTPEELCL